KRKKYADLMQNCNKSSIKALQEDSALPQSFTELLKYLESKRDQSSINTIVDLLEKTISDIKSKRKSRKPEDSYSSQSSTSPRSPQSPRSQYHHSDRKDSKDSTDRKDRKDRKNHKDRN